MSQDNLEAEEEEEDKEVIEEDIDNRHRLLLLRSLENGDPSSNSYLDDDDLVDVEVDSRLGDSSDDEDNLGAEDHVRTDRVHVDDSDSLVSGVGGVSESASPAGAPEEIERLTPLPPSWSAKLNYSSDSRDHQPNAVLPVRDQATREEDEGGGELMPLQELPTSDDEIEREVIEVTEEMVDKIADEHWDHVNGTYDCEGQWHEWNETTTQMNTQNDEVFVILPYVHTGW